MKWIFLGCKDCYDVAFRVDVQSMSVVRLFNVMKKREGG